MRIPDSMCTNTLIGGLRLDGNAQVAPSTRGHDGDDHFNAVVETQCHWIPVSRPAM